MSKNQNILTNAEFNKRYHYYEEVSNVTVQFDITRTSEILRREPPRGTLSRSFFFDKSESRWVLANRETSEIIFASNDPRDVLDFITNTLNIQIVG